MTRTILLLGAALLALPAAAQQADTTPTKTQYISDEISVLLRTKPDNDADSLGVVKSGDRVGLIESMGSGSFAHIRTDDGRDGWIAARYLSDTPAAKDRLAPVQHQLDDARGQVRDLQSQLDAAQQKLSQLKPQEELAARNQQLQAQLDQSQHALMALQQSNQTQGQMRQNFLIGGALVALGIVCGLILPRLGGRRRRYNEF